MEQNKPSVDSSDLKRRLKQLRAISSKVRNSVYHLTNRCNLRCKGCWFYTKGFEVRTNEEQDLEKWRTFVASEAERGITAPLLIGGEPALYPDRVALFREHMPFVTISTNGEVPLPVTGFEDVMIAITLFGGGPLDDELRAIRANGKRFSGLFDKVLRNYRNDPRAGFVFGLSPHGVPYMEETVTRIRDNGQHLIYNYFRDYADGNLATTDEELRLLDEALRLKEKYPDVVLTHPYLAKAMITGETEWGRFGGDACAAVSVDHPDNAERIDNGNPVLPLFNAWSADCKSLALCCTSGDCAKCRDSQSVSSWLLTNVRKFMGDPDQLRIWVEMAEAYWSQFYWSPYSSYAVEAVREQQAG